MFRMSNYVHNDLNISDIRDSELEQLTIKLANKIINESEFILLLEKEDNLTNIERLYVAAQFGRLFRGEINKKDI